MYSNRSRIRVFRAELLIFAVVLASFAFAYPASAVVSTCHNLPIDNTPTTGPDNIVGTGGPDVFAGDYGNDDISSYASDDTLCGNQDSDSIVAGDGADYINSGDNRDPGTNTLPSSTVNGGAGGDEMHGGDGGDNMYGGTGSDAQYGDNDGDTINGVSGTADFIDGGAGTDTCFNADNYVNCP